MGWSIVYICWKTSTKTPESIFESYCCNHLWSDILQSCLTVWCYKLPWSCITDFASPPVDIDSIERCTLGPEFQSGCSIKQSKVYLSTWIWVTYVFLSSRAALFSKLCQKIFFLWHLCRILFKWVPTSFSFKRYSVNTYKKMLTYYDVWFWFCFSKKGENLQVLILGFQYY